jgi:hypothetical protein
LFKRSSSRQIADLDEDIIENWKLKKGELYVAFSLFVVVRQLLWQLKMTNEPKKNFRRSSDLFYWVDEISMKLRVVESWVVLYLFLEKKESKFIFKSSFRMLQFRWTLFMACEHLFLISLFWLQYYGDKIPLKLVRQSKRVLTNMQILSNFPLNSDQF